MANASRLRPALVLGWLCFVRLADASESVGSGSAPVYPAVESLTDVQSLDFAAEGKTIHALLGGKFGTQEQSTVGYMVSRDAGLSWSKPVPLGRAGDMPVISTRGNDLRLAVSSGHIVAIWQARGEFPGSGPLVVAYSSDGGKRWSRGDNPAPGDTLNNQSYMDIAADRSGRFHLVWLDDREENGNTQGLRYSRSKNHGRHWEGETTIDGAACTCCWPRLEVMPDQTVSVLYRDDRPKDMRLARHSPGSGPWKTLDAVGAFDWQFTGCPHCGGGLASNGALEAPVLHSVVWTGKENSAGLYYLSSADAGKSWSQPTLLGDGRSREGDIASSAPNQLAVVFSRESQQGKQIRYIHSEDRAKTWSRSAPISAADSEADHPTILATALGWRAFWTETRPDGHKVLAMAPLH